MYDTQSVLHLRVVLMLGSAMTYAFAAYPLVSAQEPLIQYTFDESSGDAINLGTASGGDGVLGPMTTRTTNTPGGSSSFAVDLSPSGPESFVNGGDIAEVDTLDRFTLTTWVYLRALNNLQGGTNNVRLVAKQGNVPFNGISWNLTNPNQGARGVDNFTLALSIGGEDAFSFGRATEDLGADNSWTFVAVTYDANAVDDQHIRFFHGDETNATTMLGIPAFAPAGRVESTAGDADFGIGFTNAAPGIDAAADGFQDDVRVYGEVLSLPQLETIRLENLMGSSDQGDFNGDDVWDDADINELSNAIASGSTDLSFDMNGDGTVTLDDITDPGVTEGGSPGWLVVAGANNPDATGGSPFLNADSNLDGNVDGQDLLIWNTNKFTDNPFGNFPDWTQGNWDATTTVDGSDFLIWNANKFMSSGQNNTSVPEPVSILALLTGLCLVVSRCR